MSNDKTRKFSSIIVDGVAQVPSRAMLHADGFDRLIAIGGCDKNMLDYMIGLPGLKRPSIFANGGTIKPGAKRRDIVSVFEAITDKF